MSAIVFLNKFFGTGLDFISLGNASGWGITLGLGLVRLNGFYSVTFFGLLSSPYDIVDNPPVSENLV